MIILAIILIYIVSGALFFWFYFENIYKFYIESLWSVVIWNLDPSPKEIDELSDQIEDELDKRGWTFYHRIIEIIFTPVILSLIFIYCFSKRNSNA